MIHFIKGKLISIVNNEVVVDVNGVGYGVNVTKRVIENLPDLGEEVFILTYLDVKENSLTLYGFHDRREREIFKLLINVNGISSKTAHIILSNVYFEDLIKLISDKGSFVQKKIPGIGVKKIELIALALKDKVFALEGIHPALEKTSVELTRREQTRLDALHAMMNLGYSRAEAEKIIRDVLKEYPDNDFTTEELIKKSLEHIS
ncbi:MAG: Holliday junction branch migration protein RuvA [Ignavibacteria bacterium]